MSKLIESKAGEEMLLMGNEAIARGALEAGLSVASGYPGTPSSEIIQTLASVAKEKNLYVEWSTNEKVALEVAAAASFAELKTMCVMKQNGVNVASDFLLHLAASGTRGGIVLVTCDDPGALSSANEGESRHFARMLEFPLLEPGDFQEAKDMAKWAFDLSEEIHNIVMFRSVTRLSHASGMVRLGELPPTGKTARFRFDSTPIDPFEGPVITAPISFKHDYQQEKLRQAVALFEKSPFNTYEGPKRPELLIITSSVCFLYSREALIAMGLTDRVGILKIGTTWPLPPEFLVRHLATTDRILVVEEVIPFLEENVKIIAAERAAEIGIKTFHGKSDRSLPATGELNPDIVMTALEKIMGVSCPTPAVDYVNTAKEIAASRAPRREQTFCPGCPHRASFWNIHCATTLDNRKGFLCGDIGCYTLALMPCGFNTMKTLHCMGAGTGIASGFGKLNQFAMDQPVLSVCGDSTFYHAAMPALVNAVHQNANIIMVILDNSGTAMTGFQPHPGIAINAMGEGVPSIDIADIAKAMKAKVEISDPFDLEATQQTLLRLMSDRDGVKVLILRQKCALSPEKKGKKLYKVTMDENRCRGDACGCNRLCTRVFRCPGLVWDKMAKKARIDEVLCAGCGVCASICPAGAICKEVAA